MAESELRRITLFLKKTKQKESFCNSGMPFTNFYARFSHDFCNWLLHHPDCTIRLANFMNKGQKLNEVLSLVLPSLLQSETTSELLNEELLDSLNVNKNKRLDFLLTELGKLDAKPYIKDYLFESLGACCDVIPKNKYFSLSYNRIAVANISYRDEPVRSFDHFELFDRPVHSPVKLNEAEKVNSITVIKNSMVFKVRETDTATYMDENSMRLYNLEDGISIAIYGMIPQRQLPLESYVGYTLFSNGFPIAYGGAWLFGSFANFGINIFESFRGRESGYFLCQLLRLYRQVFEIDYFEIESYQFGLDNQEGIKTGAFWFYFHYGFRPMDKILLKLALKEKAKAKANRNYRTSKAILIRFTESNMALHLGKRIPLKPKDITNKVLTLIHKKYKGNTMQAETCCVEEFTEKINLKPKNEAEAQVLKEVSLWAAAFDITDNNKLKLLGEMVKAKPKNLFTYQELTLKFLMN